MARFTQSFESVAAVGSGVPSGTTLNGYLGAAVAGASANFKLRRAILGVRAGASVPTSQQMSIGLFRQTTRAAGTGLSLTNVGQALDPRSAASAITGVDYATGTTAGTTGPVVASTPLHKFSFNTQSFLDIPSELLEEWICDQGTANGLALVNIGNALPSAHLFTVSLEWEE